MGRRGSGGPKREREESSWTSSKTRLAITQPRVCQPQPPPASSGPGLSRIPSLPAAPLARAAPPHGRPPCSCSAAALLLLSCPEDPPRASHSAHSSRSFRAGLAWPLLGRPATPTRPAPRKKTKHTLPEFPKPPRALAPSSQLPVVGNLIMKWVWLLATHSHRCTLLVRQTQRRPSLCRTADWRWSVASLQLLPMARLWTLLCAPVGERRACCCWSCVSGVAGSQHLHVRPLAMPDTAHWTQLTGHIPSPGTAPLAVY